jgi:hypothetical protein
LDSFAPADREERTCEVEGVLVHVVSYRLLDRYVAAVDNIDPGTRIARARGKTRDEAERHALDIAALRLKANDHRRALRDSFASATDAYKDR